jgi:hypothetical protein
MKQSIIISEVQSSECKLTEVVEEVGILNNRMGLLELRSKALTDSELQNSIRFV